LIDILEESKIKIGRDGLFDLLREEGMLFVLSKTIKKQRTQNMGLDNVRT
jgi:phage antirepressor YoqD-like protein